MFDPQRASRIDRQRKRLREEAKATKRNLRTWEDEIEELEDEEDYEEPRS